MSLQPYPNYKDSGAEWLGEVPQYWNVTRAKLSIENVCAGVWGEDPTGNGEDIICVRVADFDRNRFLVATQPTTYRLIEKNQLRKRLLKKGDLLIEKSGGGEHQLVGCVVFFNHSYKAVCANFIARMQVASMHHPRFWSYIHGSLYNNKVNLIAIKQTTGIQNLDLNMYLNTLVCYPPFEEQQAIANFLDEKTSAIDALIYKKQRQIELLQEKRSALITHAVIKGLNPDVRMKDSGVEWLGKVPEHWELKKIKQVFQLKSGKGITSEKIQEKGDYPVYGGNGFRGYTSEYTHDGDYVLIGRQGALCGNINYSFGKFWASEHAIVVNVPNTCNLKWAGELLRVMNLNQFSTAAAQPGLAVETIQNIKIPIPPNEERSQISTLIGRTDKEISYVESTLRKSLELIQEYRSALITATVTGKIDVRESVA